MKYTPDSHETLIRRLLIDVTQMYHEDYRFQITLCLVDAITRTSHIHALVRTTDHCAFATSAAYNSIAQASHAR